MTRTPDARTGRATAAPSRRRIITIAAAAAGLALVPGAGPAAGPRATRFRWSGRALGTETTIVIHHRDRGVAERLVALSLDEIERLEAEFSLYRPDSALCRLNRDGVLRMPSHDMVRLLAESRRFGRISGGAFDVTVQPLWVLYAGYFAAPGADPEGPGRAAIAEALQRVDYRALEISSEAVMLMRPGMAVTLNGIAQGYITDRVADLLRGQGIDRVLIDLGEIRALGAADEDGRPWRVGLRDPFDGRRVRETLEIRNQAVATSAGAGTPFDRTGRHHHLFDPRRGLSAGRYACVTVTAPTATVADALSTALYCTAPGDLRRVLAAGGGKQAVLVAADGRRIAVGV